VNLVKRLLGLLRGRSVPALEPAVVSTRLAHKSRSTAAAFIPEATARFGQYQILEVLGRSPSGAIYRAHDSLHARQVALKIPDPTAPEFPVLRGGLQTEARVMAVLNHPNLQGVYELGEELGIPYLALELVMGTSLKSAMEQGLAVKSGVRVIVEVLAGLAAVHQRGVVHRNIKPANIIIQDRGPVKIVGLDMAVPFHASVAKDGRIVGTPAYMSPEQAQGRMLDGRSDLFSVGCILYELAAGRVPFQAETVAEVLEKMNKEEPAMSRFARSAEWEGLGIVIACAIRRSREDRFVDATALSSALIEVLQRLRDDAFPPTPRRH